MSSSVARAKRLPGVSPSAQTLAVTVATVLDEPIQLLPANDSWPLLAAKECTRLASALSLPPGQVEHIGSTSVPGLLCKPIIDVQVGLLPFPPAVEDLSVLAQLGYVAHGEAGVQDRLYFTSRGTIAFNVHVLQLGGTHWRNNLVLREYLRTSAAARARYASAKLAVVSSGAITLVAYSEAKASVISQLLAEAQAHSSAG